jgi:hypothetical protein
MYFDFLISSITETMKEFRQYEVKPNWLSFDEDMQVCVRMICTIQASYLELIQFS